MIGDGASTRDIAEWLSISPKNVEAHLFRIYREAPGHPYAVFGVWSNAAALIAATDAYRVLLG